MSLTDRTAPYTGDEIARCQGAALDLLHALRVLTLTDHVRSYLAANDPKALEQATRAVQLATGVCGAQGGAGVFCDRRAGHAGPHGDCHETWTGGTFTPDYDGDRTAGTATIACLWCHQPLAAHGAGDACPAALVHRMDFRGQALCGSSNGEDGDAPATDVPADVTCTSCRQLGAQARRR